ncbi:LysR substrate-binding domain-containing protein [Galbitalea sp. SE-J8]|uniref:LysR substrate-binding domain-containing protein n=1 Tax=Galbitalea sp. SE-J8 TaxID=3054952 RepID=UPI00259C7268|nr:LysR substrate-binding domain-containing protein [Galbitalea sp. SE-J8]MDM4761844.1 LysR substrate-binding domain-containing protein [Galbitalea sp. SE-J8]
MLDLHTLRIVRALAATGTLTAAARDLGYSQPALSQHLARAEARLGVPLLERHGRGVRLTEAGALLARHAVYVQAALGAAEEELATLRGLGAGTVRVAAFPTASSTILPRLIATIAARHPGLRVSYVEAEPPEAVQLVRDGDADLAVTFSYPGDRADPHAASASGLVVDTLFAESLVLATPAGGAAIDSIEELAAATWIAGCPRCRGHLLAVCEAAGFAPAIGFETDNAAAVLSLVGSGLGVALLPRLALVGAHVPDGAHVRDAPFAGDRLVHAVRASGSRQASVAAVAEALRDLDARAWGLDAATARHRLSGTHGAGSRPPRGPR